MKGYMIVHCLIPGVRAGVQGAHAMTELMLRYADKNDSSAKMARLWAGFDKTLICLNGGASSDMHKLWELLNDGNCPFPHAKFHESEDYAEGLLTAIAIVLPEEDKIEDQRWIDLSPEFYYYFKSGISEMRLAQ